MPAWEAIGGAGRIRRVRRPVPEPGGGDVLVRIDSCGVCRTDLHVTEGDLPVHKPHVIPGHEAVGRVVALGEDAARFELGDRVGIAWLRATCGACRWCRSGRENLCRDAQFTGWDADGGYALYATVAEVFAYRIPEGLPSEQAAPLLCAGIIGYRALRRADLPPGGRLGIYGFGASAHLTAQIAVAQGAEVHVMTRGADARRLALDLGVASAGPADAAPPVPLDASILFAPAGELVPTALAGLEQGGTLVVAGIHLSDIPQLNYAEHLFRERRLTSVTANTRRDGEELFRLAARLGLRAAVTPYAFSDADRALDDLARGAFSGVAVLSMPDDDSSRASTVVL
ncbi:zinc-dependent alcohol dehydrogenase family protein [Sinomonas sp. ASV322]|uniref:zinc-dependent alcohol dehydrogenase family protein n=1 Tax=Sinomonas sp. ASV322 TaxID=3041920 RepID=UPI0027DDC94A|nr:zinc-dependent alcohol dehydrogenase family protein [Sinomonas sp. ASV322]MDQ4503105.1 zinc-dependent alcohol dehydrogenase family protein [Sinomonas sp. ASV322]